MMSVGTAAAADWVAPTAAQGPELLGRTRAEYRESPGLSLTLAQAGRLWSLDERIAAALLRALVEEGFLRITNTGRYVRADIV